MLSGKPKICPHPAPPNCRGHTYALGWLSFPLVWSLCWCSLIRKSLKGYATNSFLPAGLSCLNLIPPRLTQNLTCPFRYLVHFSITTTISYWSKTHIRTHMSTLANNPFCVQYIANISSACNFCHLTLFLVFFIVQKVFIFIRWIFLISHHCGPLEFVSCLWGLHPNNDFFWRWMDLCLILIPLLFCC